MYFHRIKLCMTRGVSIGVTEATRDDDIAYAEEHLEKWAYRLVASLRKNYQKNEPIDIWYENTSIVPSSDIYDSLANHRLYCDVVFLFKDKIKFLKLKIMYPNYRDDLRRYDFEFEEESGEAFNE